MKFGAFLKWSSTGTNSVGTISVCIYLFSHSSKNGALLDRCGVATEQYYKNSLFNLSESK